MPIFNDQPITIEPVPAKVYDKLWLKGFSTLADVPGTVKTRAVFVPYRTGDDGDYDFAPNQRENQLTFSDEDLFTMHVRRPELDEALGQVLDNFDLIRSSTPSNILALLETVAQGVGMFAKIQRAQDKAEADAQNDPYGDPYNDPYDGPYEDPYT